jgi:hypothetical protein
MLSRIVETAMMTCARIARTLSMTLVIVCAAACGRKSDVPAKETLPAHEASAPVERSALTIKNFLANPLDGKGQRLLVRGDNAVALGKGRESYSISNLLIQTERNGTADMAITAPRCIYNTTNNTFYSDGELLVRTMDQRLSLQGRGFLFLQRESRLIISNDVNATVRMR